MLTTLIPKIIYSDIAVGLDLFVDGIGMQVRHRDESLIVAGRDQTKVFLLEDAELADISARRPDLLHPNLDQITRQPWGPRELALLDATTVCIIFREWSD